MTLDGKVALITGGTSGIGKATALLFAEHRAKVAITGRNAERGAAVVAACETHGVAALFLAADLTDAAVCAPLVAKTIAHFGRLDMLINNAGITHAAGTLETTDAQYFEQVAVNVTAPFLLSREAARAMKSQGGGAIVNVASDLGLRGEKGITAYCATKGAVIQLTRAMAVDQAEDNIRVNAVCPGEIHTRMLEGAMLDRGYSVEDGLAMLRERIPIKRIGKPEEIARAILFLASDEASFCTGAILSADGGTVAR
jgi:NAD(P)-dependent dehydrogenase (short-subunit alcohol dehydrogenase family)